MKLSLFISTISLSTIVLGLKSSNQPKSLFQKKDANGQSNYTDADILQYALTLEHLEATFYKEGLANYSLSDFEKAGFNDIVRNNIDLLAAQEATHVNTLTAGLSAVGQTPVSACNYSFGTTDVKSFLSLASVLESVGVSAYLGAAPYITSPIYLSIAGAILTDEARHQTYLALVDGASPYPSPFDTAAGLRQVITLAGSFITSCPSGSAPSLKGFPALTVGGNSTAPGSDITLTAANITSNETMYCAFISGISNASFTTFQNSKCQVPSSLVGQTYVVLANSNSSLTDENTVAGPAILALGPGSEFTNTTGTSSTGNSSVSGSSSNGGSSSDSSNDSSYSVYISYNLLALIPAILIANLI